MCDVVQKELGYLESDLMTSLAVMSYCKWLHDPTLPIRSNYHIEPNLWNLKLFVFFVTIPVSYEYFEIFYTGKNASIDY